MTLPGPSSSGPADGARPPLSFRNHRMQRVRRLVSDRAERRRERAFVLEGNTLVADALEAGLPVEAVYVDADALASEAAGRTVEAAEAAGVGVWPTKAGVIARVADTVTPQGVLAVAPIHDVTIDDLPGAGLVVVCVDVRDPGNLGTVIRSARGSGAGGVICCGESVDVYNPKCVRASAGSLLHTRVVAAGEPLEVLEALAARGFRRLGTAATGHKPYYEVDLTGPTAVVVGNESQGLPPAVSAVLDDFVTIPLTGGVESLNLAMAASVICFEAARQRAFAGE